MAKSEKLTVKELKEKLLADKKNAVLRMSEDLRNLSQACGISYSNLCNMENCKTSPSLNTLVNVCEALDAEILIKEKIRE